ncbi:MAG: class I SAM-dependent methyltransferase [Pseudomonadales bacterium]|nr:class I SAM-dependent methyltransferase [Pseudomonadales bacterium]
MIGRRTFFGAATASVALGSLLKSQAAAAAAQAAGQIAGNYDPRGMVGRLERLGTLDLESQQDFTEGFRLMHGKMIRKASNDALERVLARNGIDPTTPLTKEELIALVENEPAINIASKAWLANQQVTWKSLQDHFHRHADEYLSEMDAADRAGPGALELNPSMDVPAYTRHEIHIQPGGYVGDPFAGHMYHYGTNSFYIGVIGHNEQDQIHKGTAARIPLPQDGKVKRILDMGCGVGQMTAAMKERFPDAEVWGIDIGGPMVRYAHMRAANLGIGANFAQRLAEDTKFPDGYFDIVVSYIMHHELPAHITRAVIVEAERVTRPGGVYYPVDFLSGGTKMPARNMYGRWWDHRWNNEVWSFEYHGLDFTQEIAKRAFTINKATPAALPGFGARHAVRNA